MVRTGSALPSRFSEEYSDVQQEAVLAHELAHLARRDPAWQAAAMLACAVLWWQPLSWWSYRRLRAASEAAADEASLLLPGGPSQLAASLVSLAQRMSNRQVATVTSMQGNGLKSDLAHRVKRLLELERRQRAEQTKAGPRPWGLAYRFFVAVHVLHGLGAFSTIFNTRGHDGESFDQCVAQLAGGHGDLDGLGRRIRRGGG